MLDKILEALRQSGGDQIAQAASMDALKNTAMQSSSPVATTGSGMADFMQQGGADMSQYSGAPSMPDNNQFSPVAPQTTAQAVDAASGFDYKGMVSGLGKAAKEVQASMPAEQMTPVNTMPQGANADAIMMPTGMNVGQSGAMSAIQGSNLIGGQPNKDELMRRLMAR